jgi:DNA-binding transcriptional LysR family regulator
MDRLACNRMFAAVMELGSFAAAAARLGTSSGQASKLVARLESDLGVRLLNRTTRALSPTEAGQAYYDRLRAILDDLDALDQSVRNVAARPSGRLKVTVPLSFGTTGLRACLNEFALAYPEILLDVSFTDRLVSLVDEGFDAAIRVGRPVDSSLVARKLREANTILVASGEYLARHGEPMHPKALSSHVCVIDTNFRDPFVWRFRDGDGFMNVAISGRVRYSSAEASLGAAEAGLGIANVPDFVAEESLRAGRVRMVLRDFVDKPMGIYAMYPPGRHLAVNVRAFVDFLAEWFAARPAR